MDILSRIKQLAWSGHLIFTVKAEIEMDRDCVTQEDVVESPMNARRIAKTLTSTSARRGPGSEKLYVIRSASFSEWFSTPKVRLFGTKTRNTFAC